MASKHDDDREVDAKTSAQYRGVRYSPPRRRRRRRQDAPAEASEPAWVISGLFHVVLITTFILINEAYKEKEKKDDKKLKAAETITKMDDPIPPPEDNLTNPDVGLDAELPATVDAEIEKEINVEAPSVDGEPPGLPMDNQEFSPTVQSQLGSVTDTLAPAGVNVAPSDLGVIATGMGGRGSDLVAAGLNGRKGATKDKLLKTEGGTTETEAAVARGLAWLAKQQNPSGHREF